MASKQLNLASVTLEPSSIGLRFNPGLPRIFGPRYDWHCPCGCNAWLPADGVEPTAVEVAEILNDPRCDGCRRSKER